MPIASTRMLLILVLAAAMLEGCARSRLVRDARHGRWNGPASYTIGEVSVGAQAGADASEVVLLAMTDRGVNAMLSPSVKLGGEIGLTAGPVGGATAAATMNISADIRATRAPRASATS
jgi:lipid-binding SYLF domain-containing protein